MRLVGSKFFTFFEDFFMSMTTACQFESPAFLKSFLLAFSSLFFTWQKNTTALLVDI